MKNLKLIFFIIAVTLLFSSCKLETNEPPDETTQNTTPTTVAETQTTTSNETTNTTMSIRHESTTTTVLPTTSSAPPAETTTSSPPPATTTTANTTTVTTTVSTTIATTVSTTTKPPVTSYPEGMYKVGTDFPAGEYLLISTDSRFGSYMVVSSDSSGSFQSIVANDNFMNRSYVTLKDGQYFEIQRGKIIPIANATAAKPTGGYLPEGMYKVGFDIQAGEYKIESTDSTFGAYLEVASSSTHQFNSIVTNANFSGTKYQTIGNGQYIKIQRARIYVGE